MSAALVGYLCVQEYGCGEKSPQPFFIVRSVTMEDTKKMPVPTEQRILEVLRSMDFGQLTITVHDGRAVMLEIAKKIKL